MSSGPPDAGEQPARGNGSQDFTTFDDLVAAQQAARTNHELRPEFERRRRAFERRYGAIVEQSWTEDGGAVLTWKRSRLRADTRWLQHKTPRSLAARQEIAECVRRLTALAAKTQDTMRGQARMILLGQIYSELSSLLAYDEVTPPEPSEDARRADSGRGVIDRLEHDYGRARSRSVQVEYIVAMVVGWYGVLANGVFVWWICRYFDVAAGNERLLLASMVGGGLGAFVSVVIRMSSGDFAIEREPTRPHVWALGLLRPYYGSILGLMVYFIVYSGLVHVVMPDGETEPRKAFAWVAAVGFLAGFGERFAKDVFSAAETGVLERGSHANRRGTSN